MSQIFTKEYEEYLITGNEEPINTLANGSVEKEYFILIRKLLKEKLTPKLQKEIDTFLNRIPNYQSYRLKALNIFKKLQKNPKVKTEVIQDIKRLFELGNVKSHNKPVKYNKATTTQKDDENEVHKLPNSFNINNYIKIDKFLEDIYSGAIIPTDIEYKKYFGDSVKYLSSDFNKIPEKTLVQIFTKLDDFTIYKGDLIDFSISHAKLDYFKQVMKSVIQECLKNEETIKDFREFVFNNISSFLNEQINFLLEYHKDFNFDKLVVELINRTYSEMSKNNKERIKTLKEIKALLNKYNYKDDKMTRNVLINILDLNAKMNIFELDTFIEYIQVPLYENSSIYNISKGLREKIMSNNQQDDFSFIQAAQPSYDKDKEIVEKYLKHFFLKEKISFNKFNKYFNEKYIKQFYSEMQFYLGSEQPTKDNILSTYKIKDLMKETKLTICEFNKEQFNVNEDIELIIEIKNVQTLYVNIYEINTENYYYSNKKPFDNKISLDGIVPTYEDIFSYNDKPQLLIEKKISLSKLPKKRGLFIVEFIGNGYVSRAVIQRGNLRCIHKNTVNGKVLYILNEDNKICKGEETGIWINNVWYPSIRDTGAILIPYSVKGDFFILKHEDFCCIGTNISIPEEKYDFNGLFIINEESFIMGNVTKILVRPYLYVCDELCPLETLKNVKLTINTIKTENKQEIPSIKVIDNIELSYNKEFVFDFEVPPKLISVNFILSGEIKLKTIDKIEILQFSQQYFFNRNFEFNTLIKKNNNGNYIVHLLGKNGEPKINHQIDLHIEYRYQESSNINEPIILESDFEGKIDLGKLDNVNNIKLNHNYFQIEGQLKFTYMSSMTILENQEINLPFKSLNKNYIFLLKKKNQQIVENLSNLLKFEITDKVNNLGNITLPKLSKGYYDLFINSTSIIINVIKGKVMEIQDFIVTEEGDIKYNNNVESSIAIENVSYKNKELKIKLNKNNKSPNHPRVHIYCVQYLPKEIDKNLYSFTQSQFYQYKQKIDEQIFLSSKNKNIYLNDKMLSDEMQYVLDRKQYEINLGNSLEKPSLLLKPQFIQDTITITQKPKEGVSFKNSDDSKDLYNEKYKEKYMKEPEIERKYINVYDFINISPLIKENLIPNENGEIIINDIDLNEYSFLHILCLDNISCNEDCFFLKNGVTSLRDLRAINELDLNKNYCEFRKMYPLSKKDKHHINDITSIKYKIFDSLEKYIEFIKIVNPSLTKDLKDFDFLLNFNNLKLQEKLDKITEYFSHELNIYLYFHHNDFFNKYIYPILKYKSEKTFIDYFLLNNKDKIIKYSQPQKINELNTFEKCLLIYAIRKENKGLALYLARQIRSECPKENDNEIKRLFNIALNLKSIEEVKEEKKIAYTIEAAKFPEVDIGKILPKGKKEKKNISNNYNNDMSDSKSREYYSNCSENYSKSNDNSYLSVSVEVPNRINQKDNLFNEEGKSKEYCETQYYNKVYKDTDNISLVTPNHFFADLAQYWTENDSIRNIGFKSDNILLKPENLTQIIFMLAVLDLEERTLPKSQNLIKDKGLGLTIEANTNCYLLTKEINETQLNNDNKYALILAQMVFEADKIDKDDEKEPTKFLTNRTYLQKTIVTNISPDNITCEILLQIPEGSIPIDSEEYKVIETASINSYQSYILEQKFYFPEEGNFKQYPASASINDLVIAKSGLKTYEVVSNIQLTKEEISSIDDVLDQGNKKEILKFIKNSQVIKKEDLEKIYWMLNDKDFYSQLINILKNKYIFNEDIWEYSSNNEDIDTLQEYIYNRKQKKYLNQ